MSIGKGKYHLLFRDMNRFMVALHSSYLKENKKRCWTMLSKRDNILVVQPSVSTPGLNLLILEKELTEEEESKIKKLFEKEGIEVLEVFLIRRPSQAQGFTIWIDDMKGFEDLLNLFYPKRDRARIIQSDKGDIVVQPAVSTIELNTIILNLRNPLVGKEKEKLDKIITEFKDNVIKCSAVILPPITTNF